MALDERRISARTKLTESYLLAERQKAVMFATLNRVRQSLQDQGAQPQPDQALKASANVPDVPFLWMPHGSAGTTQQGLHGAKCLRTGSGSVGLQSVNKVHGLASPLDTLNPTVTHAEATTCTHSSSAHGITPSMSVSEHQRSEAARFTSLASQATHPSHEHSPILHPSVPSLVSEPSEQQQAAAGKPHPHPVAQYPHSHAYTHQQQAEGQHIQQQAEDQHSRQRAAAANLPKPMESGMPPPGQAEKYLSGVRRAAGGGWEARVGRHGSSKARESLGIHATAFAAARAYDRALLTTPRPSEQHGNFNFPVQDYVAAESSDLSKAALTQLRVFHDAKPSSKRLRPSPSKATHQCAPPKCNRASVSPAQLRHARDPPFVHGDAGPPLPVKRSRNQQTVADPSLHHRPAPNAEEPGNDADWHQPPVIPPQSMSQSTPQLHKVDTGLQQADIANKGSAGAVNMTRGPGLGSGLRDPNDEPSTSGNHRSWGSVMSGASLATSGRPSAQTLLPKAEPAANLDACHASALEMHSAPTGAAADTAAPDDAARHHTEPDRAARSSEAVLDTGQCPEQASLHPVVCHAHKRARAATPPAAPARPGAPAASIQPQADGPAATLHADASLPDKPAERIPGADPLPDGHNSNSASHARPAAAAEPPSSLLRSPNPETVRAEDSDNDVEIMDDSPVHMPASSASLSMPGSPSNTDDCNEQQVRDRAPYWGLAEGNQEPQLPEQLSDQQLHRKQQDVPTWQQQQHGARYQGPQQEQQQPQPGKTSQQPQQHPPQQQQRFQQFLWQQQEHLSWQHKAQQQPQQQPQAGQSCMSADLSGLSHLAQQAATAAGGAWPQPSNAAPATAVKQEPAASQSHDSAHMRGGGCPHGEAVAGSSLTHPLELSESDADSSASSSVDPSQRVPAPWLHADTAASRQPEVRGYASVQRSVVPASSVNAQAAAHALLRQASQGSTLTNGQLRTKRGPTDKAEGPRSKLARVTTAAVPAAHESRRAGATAAEAVDLSDDDNDVVIIEENMQPQGPRGLKAPAAAKQPGAPPASRSGWHVKPRVPAAAAAARAGLFGSSPSPKPSPSSSLTTPSSGTHTQHISSPPPPAIHAGEADLQASSVLSATLAALRQAATGNAQAVATSADAEESAAAAAAGVAELRRTEQQSNPEFRAAQETEWQQRQAEIGKQSEYAQRLKRQRKAEKEKKARQEAEVAKRLAEHRAEEGRKEAEEQEKDQLRIKIRERLTRKLDKAKTLRQVLTAFGIPVDGGFTATSAQVDKAYKKAMILFHPDKHVNNGLEKQLEAEESFKIISHAKNRKTK